MTVEMMKRADDENQAQIGATYMQVGVMSGEFHTLLYR